MKIVFVLLYIFQNNLIINKKSILSIFIKNIIVIIIIFFNIYFSIFAI